MHWVDDWQDFVFIPLCLMSLWCFGMLIVRFRQNSGDWTSKTVDYWYSLLMWTVVGAVTSIQGVVLDRELTPGHMAAIAAVLVTGRAIHKKGPWGGES